MLKVRYAIVCDEVRREDNGKILLIGVYGTAIFVKKFPVTLALALMLGVDADEPVNTDIHFRATLGGQVIKTGRGHLEIPDIGLNNLLAIPKMPLPLKEEGTLAFELSVDGEKWDSLIALPVRTIDLPASTEPQQPSEQSPDVSQAT